MELENLRELWNEIESRAPKGDQQIRQIIGRRSQSAISKMRRNLLVEVAVVLCCYTAFILFYFTIYEGNLAAISWFLIGISILFLVYFYLKNRLLTKMLPGSGRLRSHLESRLQLLEKYVRFYLVAGTILAPAAMLFLFGVMYLKAPIGSTSIFYMPPGIGAIPVILFWVAATAVVTIGIYYLNKWYLHRLYGMHIQRLRELLKEMDEEI